VALHLNLAVAVLKTGRVMIDTFDVETALTTTDGSISIDRFNLRRSEEAVVAYTRFYGNTVPFIDTLGILEASEDTITDESEIQTVVSSVVDSLWGQYREAGTLKMQFRYLEKPAVNGSVLCQVSALDTGIIAIPDDGGVISFGKGNFPLFFSLFEGDTFRIQSKVLPEIKGTVVQMFGGTPRLIRDGNVNVEWQEEGLTKKRFVTGKYGRTAIGVDKDCKKLILMTVEPTRRAKLRKRGISLTDIAILMHAKGAYNAMNLDGGSSATMVVDGRAVSAPKAVLTRKISTAVLVVKENARSRSRPR
ncbi:MAG: hypothetical protein CL946_09520, partial [Ectothiorhodospiraceae bacterium]|nr:hypothetical protein [Ectothiorhodospiraceae bacterium]